jgi:acylphosphatase
MIKHLKIRIYGEVQGVFYRDSAQREARALSLTGFARNDPDGSVYIEAEGEEEKLKEFLKWCKKGSKSAWVTKIDGEFSDKLEYYLDFEVKQKP